MRTWSDSETGEKVKRRRTSKRRWRRYPILKFDSMRLVVTELFKFTTVWQELRPLDHIDIDR
jgi:hypothetical protein